MTAQTVYCTDRLGRPKETFYSREQARRALAHKRRFRHRRWPTVYHCPCGAWHLTNGEER